MLEVFLLTPDFGLPSHATKVFIKITEPFFSLPITNCQYIGKQLIYWQILILLFLLKKIYSPVNHYVIMFGTAIVNRATKLN
jgi:hypothetical protein